MVQTLHLIIFKKMTMPYLIPKIAKSRIFIFITSLLLNSNLNAQGAVPKVLKKKDFGKFACSYMSLAIPTDTLYLMSIYYKNSDETKNKQIGNITFSKEKDKQQFISDLTEIFKNVDDINKEASIKNVKEKALLYQLAKTSGSADIVLSDKNNNYTTIDSKTGAKITQWMESIQIPD